MPRFIINFSCYISFAFVAIFVVVSKVVQLIRPLQNQGHLEALLCDEEKHEEHILEYESFQLYRTMREIFYWLADYEGSLAHYLSDEIAIEKD